MIIQYILYSISYTFSSWIVGLLLNGFLIKMQYDKNLLNLNFIKSDSLNRKLGLGIFKWIVKNTFFKNFNQKLKLKNKIEITELLELRKEMTFSEINHLIGFGFITVISLVKMINGDFSFGIIMMIINILLNLYPSLLQQANKRRIDKLLMSAQKINNYNKRGIHV